jgi:transcriptional regulator with XRE-family HTH domain
MIEEKVQLVPNRPVLDQIVEIHGLSYKELSKKLELTDGALRKIRRGSVKFKMTMRQVKVFQKLLEPFDKRLEDLPDDWILEKNKTI